MGVLDAPGLSKTTADSRYAAVGSAAVPFMSRLNGGRESASMLVMGDSTGDETNVQGRWVLLTAQWLAAQYPAYTVNFRQWNYSGDAWDALGTGQSRVIQTGTGTSNGGGPFVIDVWNGSASGQAPSYHYNTVRFQKHTSVGPHHLVIINHGHNINGAVGAFAAYEINKLARAARDKYPTAGVMVTAQNASGPSASDYANDYLRARAVQTLAATEGYGLVNIFQKYVNNPTYVADWISAADGLWLHPSSAGSSVWAAEVQRHLNTAKGATPAPRGPNAPGPDRLWVPAKQFDTYAGTPTYALVNGEQMMWAFANGVDSEVIASVDIPSNWASYDAYLVWTVAGSSGWTAGTVVAWNLYRQQQITSSSLPYGAASFPVPAWAGPTAVTLNPSNGSAYQTFVGALSTQSTFGIGQVTGVRVKRNGANASDNIAATAYMLGVMFVKAASA